jgi:hypothetical protein
MSLDDSTIQDGEAKMPRMDRTAASRGWPRDARHGDEGHQAHGEHQRLVGSPRGELTASGPRTLSGPRYLASYLLALPVIVVTLASTGVDQVVSGAIALSWLVLAPTALYSRRAAQVLPYLSFVFLGLALLLLRFSSVAFVVDVTATVIMFLVSMPRPDHGHAPSAVHPSGSTATPSTARV